MEDKIYIVAQKEYDLNDVTKWSLDEFTLNRKINKFFTNKKGG